MNSTIIFLSLIILVLSAMLIFKISINLDINQNLLKITIKLFFIKIITIKFSLLEFYYQINNSKKLKSFNIFDDVDAYLITQIKTSIIDKLYYDNIDLKSDIGAFTAKDTAIIIGMLNLICDYLSKILILKNKDIKFEYLNCPNFCNANINIQFNLKVYFTIFDLIFALLTSFFKRGRYVKEKRKYR